MLSGGKIPTIRAAAGVGPKTSIGSVKTLGTKTLKNPKDKDSNTNQEEDTEAAKSNKQAAQKEGSETSIDAKVKKLLKNVQKAREVDGKNPDPNAPINSEKDPSRFDLVNKLEGNSKEDAAKNFGFSMPGTGGKQDSQQQAAQAAQQQAAANPITGVGGGFGGGFGGGASSGGGGGSHQGGGIPGTGGVHDPGHGGGTQHVASTVEIQSMGGTNVSETRLADGHRTLAYNAEGNIAQSIRDELTRDNFTVTQQADGSFLAMQNEHLNEKQLQNNDPLQNNSLNSLDTSQQVLASSDVNAEKVQQAQEQPRIPEPDIKNQEQQVA